MAPEEALGEILQVGTCVLVHLLLLHICFVTIIRCCSNPPLFRFPLVFLLSNFISQQILHTRDANLAYISLYLRNIGSI